MAPKFRINIYTGLDLFINVHLHNGTRIIFKQCGAGIYYFGTTNEDFEKYQNKDYTLLNAVDSNTSCFHKRETKGADGARILQKIVGWLSTQNLK